jgi:hypothetical protein
MSETDQQSIMYTCQQGCNASAPLVAQAVLLVLVAQSLMINTLIQV